MNDILPDILRSSVSGIMFTFLLFTMAQPKYGKKRMYMAILCVLIIDLVSSVYFYLEKDYTTLAKFDVFLFLMLCILLKPLFRESIMQWFFNYVTAMNVYVVVLILSYTFSRYLPFSLYANTLLRFLFFLVIIFLFHCYIRPLYQQVLEHWNVFFCVVVGVGISFAYYILSSSDIIKTLNEQFVPLFLFILLTVLIYITIFYSLKIISSKYALREEHMKTQMQYELQRMSMDAIQVQIKLIEKEHRTTLQGMEQVRRLRHDMKHHFFFVTALLRQHDTDGALAYISKITEELPQKKFSDKNLITESFLSKYRELCECNRIAFSADIGFDEDKIPNKTHLGVILGNVLQNAYDAVQSAPEQNRMISVVGRQVHDNLLLVVKNGYDGILSPGYKTTKPGNLHGFGLASIKKAAEEYGGYVEIEHTDREFTLTVVLTIFPMAS